MMVGRTATSRRIHSQFKAIKSNSLPTADGFRRASWAKTSHQTVDNERTDCSRRAAKNSRGLFGPFDSFKEVPLNAATTGLLKFGYAGYPVDALLALLSAHGPASAALVAPHPLRMPLAGSSSPTKRRSPMASSPGDPPNLCSKPRLPPPSTDKEPNGCRNTRRGTWPTCWRP